MGGKNQGDDRIQQVQLFYDAIEDQVWHVADKLRKSGRLRYADGCLGSAPQDVYIPFEWRFVRGNIEATFQTHGKYHVIGKSGEHHCFVTVRFPAIHLFEE